MLHEIPRNDSAIAFYHNGLSTGQLAECAEQVGASVIHCPPGPDHVFFAQRLTWLLADGGYDLIHNHLEVYRGLPIWLAHRAAIPLISSFNNTERPPQVSWTHLPFIRQLRPMYRSISINYALRHSDLVTGCSQGIIKSLDPQGRRIPRGYVRILYYGVHISEPPTSEDRAALRTSFGWPAKLLLVGDGLLRPAIEQAILKYGLSDCV